jgi:hypothetical protein
MHAFTQCNVQNSSFSFAKRAKLPLLSLRSFPLTCGIVFGVSDAEEREVYYILLVLRYVYLVRKEKNSDDAGRMCECACFCVCLPPSSLSLSLLLAAATQAKLMKRERELEKVPCDQ